MAFGTMFVGGLVTFATLLVASPTWAQSRLATIEGRVVDATGGVLSGVTISTTSPALQVPQVRTVSSIDGSYRISELPIGL